MSPADTLEKKESPERKAPRKPDDQDPAAADQKNAPDTKDAQPHAQPAHGHGSHGNDVHDELPKDLHKPGPIMIIGMLLLLAIVVVLMYVVGYMPHKAADSQAVNDVKERQADVPTVEVQKPTRSAGTVVLSYFSNVKPNQITQIFPQATGYMKKQYVDIQDKVKQGQLLAEIDEKDVDAQLTQAKASLTQSKANAVRAQSDLDLANRTFDRYKNLKGPGGDLIATPQELDEKRTQRDTADSALNQANAAIAVAEADVERLEVLKSYQKVIAPFDGTITTRNYDIGALLTPGTTTPGREMFTIVDGSKMRVFVNIPQTDATNIHIGQDVTLEVPNYPGRLFKGTVARQASALDPNTRTESFELDFANPNDALLAGMYGVARIPVTFAKSTLLVPTSALVFNSAGVQLMTIKDDKVHFQQVKLGRDLGTQLEVLEGVTDDELIVVNPGSRLNEGDPVNMKMAAASTTPPPSPSAASSQNAGK